MRAPISVIIPTLNAEAALPGCLTALGEGLAEGLIRELVITDGGSSDSTLRIAEEAGAKLVAGPASRGAQLRRGAAAAEGEWLLFVHADTVLQPGWTNAVQAGLTRSGAYYAILRFDAVGLAAQWVSLWANFRARFLGLPYGDQTLLIDRTTYDAVGGFADIPLMEDVAMARALKGRLRILPMVAVTSAERYKAQGWARRGARNLVILTRYLLGADPERLATAYRK